MLGFAGHERWVCPGVPCGAWKMQVANEVLAICVIGGRTFIEKSRCQGGYRRSAVGCRVAACLSEHPECQKPGHRCGHYAAHEQADGAESLFER
jgi:hypothetical protein